MIPLSDALFEYLKKNPSKEQIKADVAAAAKRLREREKKDAD